MQMYRIANDSILVTWLGVGCVTCCLLPPLLTYWHVISRQTLDQSGDGGEPVLLGPAGRH